MYNLLLGGKVEPSSVYLLIPLVIIDPQPCAGLYSKY